MNRALRLDSTSYRAVWRTLSGRCDLEGVVVNLVDGVPSLRTSGQAAAALPRSATKLRRLMQYCPRGQSLPKGSVVRHSKIDHRMAEMGQTRSSGDVGSMSGLPESGHGTCIGTAPTCRSGHRRHSPNGRLWNIARSLHLDIGGLDHLAPLLGIVGDELAEVVR